ATPRESAARARAAGAERGQGASSAPAAALSPAVHRLGAAPTQADDGKVGEARAVAEGSLDQLAHAVELLGRHRKVVAAALARQVLPLAIDSERVLPRAVPQMDVPDEADFVEGLQIAIHGCDVRGGPAAADALTDLLRRHGAIGHEQCFEHETPSGG